MDAGCGEGRNLRYFVDQGNEVYGIDQNPMAIKMAQMTFKSVPKECFIQSSISEIPFSGEKFDLIICSAVLHFAKNEQHFDQMFGKLINILTKSGLMFIRMASEFGITNPNARGSFSYLLTQNKLKELLDRYPLKLAEPLKSVLVEQKRSMSVLLFEKV